MTTNNLNRTIYHLVVLTSLLLCLPVQAQKPVLPTPKTIAEAPTLSAEEFITLVGNTPNLVIVDARISKDRSHGYIEGSLSLPDIKTSCNNLANILPEKTTPVVFYCNGIKCGRSVRSIKIANLCGYTNLHWFRGGFDEWKQKDFPILKK